MSQINTESVSTTHYTHSICIKSLLFARVARFCDKFGRMHCVSCGLILGLTELSFKEMTSETNERKGGGVPSFCGEPSCISHSLMRSFHDWAQWRRSERLPVAIARTSVTSKRRRILKDAKRQFAFASNSLQKNAVTSWCVTLLPESGFAIVVTDTMFCTLKIDWCHSKFAFYVD